MEAPAGKGSREDLQTAIQRFITSNCRKVEGGKANEFECITCGSPIEQTTLYASVHVKEFGSTCAGEGSVEQFPLPYCPKCEGEPRNTRTCIHVPIAIPNPA